MASLASLPPEILANITALIDLVDQLKLLKLCGDKILIRKCVHLGGFQVMSVQNPASMALLLQSWLSLTFFPRLTCLHLGTHASSAYDIDIPKYPLWTLDLPSTMLEIKIKCKSPLDLWVRPVDPKIDDTYVQRKCVVGGLTAQSLRERFPQLHTLHLHGIYYWSFAPAPDGMKRRFVDHLPPSLTSLRIPYCKLSAEPEFMLPPIEILQGLSFFKIDDFASNMPAGALFGFDVNAFSSELYRVQIDDKFTSGYVAPEAATIGLANLTHLGLARLKHDDSFALLGHLTNLQTLKCQLQYEYSKLKDKAIRFPPNLTRLRTSFPFNQRILSATLQLLPQLTHLDCYFHLHELSNQSITIEVSPLWKILKLGAVGGAKSIKLILPATRSLTQLHFPATAKDVNIECQDLEGLRTLRVPSYAPAHFAWPIPSTLTSLNVFEVACALDHLRALPKTLRKFTGKLRLNRIHLKSLSSLKSWTVDLVKECVRQRTLPQVPSENFTVTYLMKPILVKELQSVTRFEEYKPGDHLQLAPQFGRGFMLPSLRVIDTAERISYLKVGSLPAGLAELFATQARWFLPYESKRSARRRRIHTLRVELKEALEKPDYQLPSYLRKLEITPRLIKVDRPDSERPPEVAWTQWWRECSIPYFYPFLATAPLLQTLSLHLTGERDEKAILSLPPTITDLTIELDVQVSSFFPAITNDWLPNLAHIRMSYAKLLYSDWRSRLPSLSSFNVKTVVVRQSDFSPKIRAAFDALKGSSASHDTQFVIQHLFPARLRTCEIKLQLDWLYSP